MGMPEISSVPLAVMDHLKNFKPLAQRFPNLNEARQVIFSLLFLPIRGVYWPCEQRSQPSRASHVDRGRSPVRRMAPLTPPTACALADSSVWFWKMSLATLSAGSVLPATWVIYIFCVANVLMTALQWYWSSLILKGLYAKMTGAKSPVDDEVERKQAKKI
jgi:hypothetical protein